MALKFLADMNISLKTVEALQRRGWDVLRVSQCLSIHATDQEILEFARRERRVLITQDLDFSALLALSGHNQPSLVTLRLAVSDPETITRRLLQTLPLVEQALQEGCAVTIEDVRIRIRRLPIGLES